MPLVWPFAPGIVAPGSAQAGSVYAPDWPVDLGVPFFFRQADFLALVDRILPNWYVDPMKTAVAGGYELLRAYGLMWEQVSHAVGELEVLSLALFSSGGNFATASVEFYRTSLASGAFTVKAGTIVSTSRTERQYVLTADVVFTGTDWYKPGIVRSLGQDSDYNVPGPVATSDAVRAGEIDTIDLPYTSPVFADTSLAVRQAGNAQHGVAPVLDQIGNDRGIARLAGEKDAAYKSRVTALPDTVSPAAIKRHLDKIFYQVGLHYDHIETWENRYEACWNADYSAPADPVFGTLEKLAYNDTRDNRFIPRWMGEVDHRGAFVVVLPNFPALADRGMAYNDPTLTPTSNRAASAWNSPTLDGLSLAGAYNADDTAGSNSRSAFLGSMWDLLNSIKGGGVNISLVLTEANETLPGAPYP